MIEALSTIILVLNQFQDFDAETEPLSKDALQRFRQLVNHYERGERCLVNQVFQHVVQVAELMRCGVLSTSMFGLRLLLKGVQQNGLHGSWVGFKGERKLQDLNRDVAKRIMGRQLVFDHIQSRLLAGKIEQIAVGYPPKR